MNDAAAPGVQPRSAPPRTTPVLTCTIRLNTDFAQRVYKRTWDRLKGDLYVLTVRTRSNGMEEAAKAIETILSEAFGSARKDLDEELARTDTLIDDVKLTDLPEYEGALESQAKFSTPRAKEYLNLILKLDQLLMRYDALWLAGFIETQPRVQRSYNWQRRLIKIANRLRELGNRTRVGLAREGDKRSQTSAASSIRVADHDAGAVHEAASPDGTETAEETALESDAEGQSAAQEHLAERADADGSGTPPDGGAASTLGDSDAIEPTHHLTNGVSPAEVPTGNGPVADLERAAHGIAEGDAPEGTPTATRRRRKSALAATSEY